MAEVPALSPLPALPPKPALSALLAVAPAVTPPEAESPLKQLVILQPWLSRLDYHNDAQPARRLPSMLV